MHFKTPLLFLAALAPLSMALPHGHEIHHAKRAGWTATPSNGGSTAGFGGRSKAGAGTVDTYKGNTGATWGSNIMEISAKDAPKYQYVAEVNGDKSETWSVVVWNKMGKGGKMTGQYGESALSFDIAPGEKKYIAFDKNTQGAMGAAPKGKLPKTEYGAYAVTYGEFDFGNGENNAWSGFDVSAIQVQLAGKKVQGMKMCDALGKTCSSITTDAKKIDNAYSKDEQHIGGIGGNLPGGPSRIAVTLGYDG